MRALSGARWYAAQAVAPSDAARMGVRTYAMAVATTGATTASAARDTMDEYRNLHHRGPGGGSGDYQFTRFSGFSSHAQFIESLTAEN